MKTKLRRLFVEDDKIVAQVPLPQRPIAFWAKLGILLLVVLSIFATILSFSEGVLVAYNDARAHLNMARAVVDGLKPGLAQLGSVWLPLNHVLSLPLIWNNWLWHSGLAGSYVSMAAYIAATIFIYKILKESVSDHFAAVLGVILFATNLNILYMQTTPMTEMTLLLFFITTTFFLYRYATHSKLNDLLLAALSIFFATLTRYDGWFLLLVVGLLLPCMEVAKKVKGRVSLKKILAELFMNKGEIEGKTIIFLTLASFGVLLWFLWNLVIFKDPLYFALGPFSAHSQQDRIEAAGSLYTKNNLSLSIAAYWWAMVHNAGLFLVLFSLLGFGIYAWKFKFSAKAMAVYTLITPLVFHIVSLYFGHSILVLPELGVNVTSKVQSNWFNVRYGLMALPAVAFFAAHLASRDKLLKAILVVLIVIQPIIFIKSRDIITITDGVVGTSSLEVGDVSEWLAQNVESDNDLILSSMAFNSALAFNTGFNLKQFIHEGTGIYWETSLVEPEIYAKWIVMARGDVGDPVYDALVKEDKSSFLDRYALRHSFAFLNVYERRDTPRHFVYTENGDFMVDGEKYSFVGVNSYDLLYLTPEDINKTLQVASESGIEVIRFWVFGENFDTALHPDPGEFDEERLKNLDRILASARQHNIRLILTFANYWSDYGGVPQYLQWLNLPNDSPDHLDEFYDNDEIRSLYKYYVSGLVSRKNSITGIKYREDPTIFAWELMNEPRSASYATSNKVIRWITEMTDYVKSLDTAHLILPGTEGFILGSSYTPAGSGPLLTQIGSVNEVSVLTSHYYLHDTREVGIDFSHPVISDWKDYADEVDKPLILEEVGFSKNRADNGGVSRDILYTNLFNETERGVGGVILWNWALKIDDNYGISPLDVGDKTLLNIIKEYSIRIKNDI